jgi:tRNA nucleotidyltransferase (CCA-adding enzyme)
MARDRGLALYLVGGGVRDLVLGRDGYDLDLAAEGDVDGLARDLAAATGGRVVVHDRFGTATVKGRGFAIDLARTRRETYPHPGSLPHVEPATLAEDLARRDFTINAVALRLSPEPAEVVDPYRGVADIHSSLVRVLHERSFHDDATRMLRAVRYAARLEFKIARQTELLIQRDLDYVKHISGPRLRRELALLFEEPSAVEGTLMAQRLGVLEAIHPALKVTEAVAERWREALEGIRAHGQTGGHAGVRADGHMGMKDVPLDELGFCVLAAPKDEGTTASVAKWLHLAGRIEKGLQDLVRLRVASPKLAGAAPSRAVEVFDDCAPSPIQALGVIEGGDVLATCDAYLRTWRHVKPALDGNALIALGMAQGPQLGEMLKRLRGERLEGRITTREQEMAMVRAAISGTEGSGKR